MVKPIYCNLLLIFWCLIYEAYGGDPYNDSLSSSIMVNDAEENTATLKSVAKSTSPCYRPNSSKGKLRMRVPPGMGSPVFMPEKIKPNYPYSAPIGVSEDEANKIRNNVLKKSVAQSPSPRHRRKSFSSNNYLKYGRKRESVQDNRSTNNIHPYNDSLSSSTTVNDAGENPATLYIESAALSPLPRLLWKSFISTEGLGYDRNRRFVQNSKSQRSMNRRMPSRSRVSPNNIDPHKNSVSSSTTVNEAPTSFNVHPYNDSV